METLVHIVGSVALLLWGVRMVRTGFNRSFGAELRRLVTMSASNRVSAVGAGLAIAAVLQSSTATAAIVASFAVQGLLSSVAALALVLGADVGTAVVVQVLSIDLKWASPLLIAGGVGLFLSSDRSRRRNLGRILIGLGLILLSLKLIVLASAPLRETAALSVVLQPLASEPLLGILFVALITWLSHSSVAMVLLFMSLASVQVLSVQTAMIFVLGANVGSGLAAVGLTMGMPAAARRVTLGNLSVRTLGALAAVPFIPYVVPYLDVLGAGPGYAVINFHLAFNVALAAVFLPLLGLVARALECFVVNDPLAEEQSGPRYLDAGAIETPAVALSCAAREALYMGDEVRRMLDKTLMVFQGDDDRLRKEIESSDDIVDGLHEAIKLYLTRLNNEELDTAESSRSIEILSFTTNLEHIGDIIDKNLMELAAKKIKGRKSFSREGLGEIEAFHTHIIANLDLALSVFMSGDSALAKRLIDEKAQIRTLERQFTENHFGRIGDGLAESIQTSALHLDVLRDLKRINSHITAVAYPILERAGMVAESRRWVAADEAGENEQSADVSTAPPVEANRPS